MLAKSRFWSIHFSTTNFRNIYWYVGARRLSVDVTQKVCDVRPYQAIPGPWSLPVIGTALHYLPRIGMLSNPEFKTTTQKLHERYGPIVRVNMPIGYRDLVFVMDVDDIEQILRIENKSPKRDALGSMDHFRKVLMKDEFNGVCGLLFSEGEEWKKIRTQVNPVLLKKKTIDLYANTTDEIVSEFIDSLKSLRNEKNKVEGNFKLETNKWALESISIIALGTRLGCLKADLPKDSPACQLIKSVEDVYISFDRLDFSPSLWKLYATPEYKKGMEVYEKQVRLSKYYIDKAIKDIQDKKNEGSYPNTEGVLEKLLKVDSKVALVMAIDMLFGGVDSTVQSIIAILYLFAINPDKQNILREHIRRGNGDRTYLKACIKEGMRLMPVASANSRTATTDHTVKGYKVPKGVNMLFPHEYLSLQESQYKNADKFIPERWLVDEEDPLYYGRAHAFTTMPFGYGVRSCIGRRIAEQELEAILWRMIDVFHIEWDGPPAVRVCTFLNYFKNPDHFVLNDAPR